MAWLLLTFPAQAYLGTLPLSIAVGGTASASFTPTALTNATTVTVPAVSGYGIVYTLSLTTAVGSVTVSNPTSFSAGQAFSFILTEDSTGAEGISFGSDYNFLAGPPKFNTAANAKNVVNCIADTSSTLQCASFPLWGPPTQQYFTTGTGATYTTPAGATLIVVTACGGGGGGSGSGETTAPTGTAGGTTIFNSVDAAGGSGGTGSTSAATGGSGGAGGTGGTGTATWRQAGQVGQNAANIAKSAGGTGGVTLQGVVGSGGQGATPSATTGGGGGGGGGECFKLRIANPSSTYTYTVGGGGAGGIGTGTGLATGVTGITGAITVDEFYDK
jgi:hypothetical protein